MSSGRSCLSSCAMLASLTGCVIDRSALASVDAGAPDARATYEDAPATPHEDASDGLDAVGVPATCGDGALAAGEECDDGNAVAGDGCDPSCSVESGHVCTGEPSACSTTCGDRMTVGREECDDGGVADGDGCDASCRLETKRLVRRGPGLALDIPDDAYDGTMVSMTCVELDVRPFALDTVASLEVELAMRHPWVADLVIKLVGPGGTPVVTLMSRPSLDERADDGMGRNGNWANLDPASPIRFVTGAAVSAEDMGDGIGDGNVCAADGVCDFAPNAGAAAPGDLTSFVGGPASGAWRFCVGDAAGADIGAIDAVSLVMELER